VTGCSVVGVPDCIVLQGKVTHLTACDKEPYHDQYVPEEGLL
jgi:hypothetical protein